MENLHELTVLSTIVSWFLFSMPLGEAQETICTVSGECNHPFSEIPSNSPVVSPDVVKNYRISVNVIFINPNDTEINATIFTTAANDFYNTDSVLQGFFSPITIQSSSANQVIYSVQYNYTMLNSSVSGSDAMIRNTLGNTTYVDEGLKMDPDFQANYNVSSATIIGGNCVCSNNSDSICSGYPDYICTSRLDGVSVSCTIAQAYCFNGGFCFRNEGDGKKMCSCQNTINYWHVGERCETMFHIWMVIVFFVVVGLVLFLVIPILTFYCIRTIDKRLLKEKEKEEKKKLKIAAKELEEINRGKAEKEQNGQKTEDNGTANLNGNASFKVVPDPKPRQNIPPAYHTSADSFDESSLTVTNPASTRDDQRNSQMNPPNQQIPHQPDDAMYATVVRTRSPYNTDSTSETSSSTSEETGPGGYSAGGNLHPPVPYHNPPSYINLSMPSQIREEPMVTTV